MTNLSISELLMLTCIGAFIASLTYAVTLLHWTRLVQPATLLWAGHWRDLPVRRALMMPGVRGAHRALTAK
jgi:hypothetical protein